MANFSLKKINYKHSLVDVAIFTLSLYLSLILRLGWDGLGNELKILNRYLVFFLLLRLATFYVFGIYRIIWRYCSGADLLKLVRAILSSTVLIISATYLIDLVHLPRSVFFIDALLLIVLLGGIRYGRRVLHEYGSKKSIQLNGGNTVIVGAGTNGRALAQRLSVDAGLGRRLVGFIDDDSQKIGKVIAGLPVLGGCEDLGDVIKQYRVQEIIVSTKKISGPPLREIVQCARIEMITLKVLGDSQKFSNSSGRGVFRNVELSDLLSRSQTSLDTTSISNLIRGRRVLITGAGGTIGSELARQIIDYFPGSLLLLDHSEFNLYKIDQELKNHPQGKEILFPLLADVKDRNVMSQIFRDHAPEVVFHAAAYKHVHLVEQNPFSAILNNVQGTMCLLEFCKAFQVESFVLVSTDKAVNPAGVMGATKRVCELLVAAAGQATGKKYCAVRFGNVLGSSGSLIPLLQEQITNGEPVTITHPDMTRYFMLIPEAVSLVLKAATIAEPGYIMLLRMGEPLRIVDVARSLIILMGKTEMEIPIIYTGIRPGEKLFEELFICGNEINTEHPDILIVPKGDGDTLLQDASLPEFESRVHRLIAYAFANDAEALVLLKTMVRNNRAASLSETPDVQIASTGELKKTLLKITQ